MTMDMTNVTASDYEWVHWTLKHTHTYFMRPLICLIGITGNSMAILLIRNNAKLWKLPSNIYLFWLALSSTTFLSILLLSWIDMITSFNYYHRTIFACKLFNFIAYTTEFVCSWLIVSVCCDRLIVFYWPMSRFKWCTRKVAFRLSGLVFLIGAIFYTWVLVFSTIIPMNHESRESECAIDEGSHDIYLIFTWIDTLLCVILPVIIITVTNVLVLIRFKRHRKFQEMAPKVRFRASYCTTQQTMLNGERENLHAHTSIAQNGTNGLKKHSLNTTALLNDKQIVVTKQENAEVIFLDGHKHRNKPANQTVTLAVPCDQNGHQNGSVDSAQNTSSSDLTCGATANGSLTSTTGWRPLRASDLQLTSALLCVTTAFLILLTPNYIFRSVTWFMIEYLGDGASQSKAEKIIELMIYMIYYSHHALLFYLYIFWSPQMKKKLGPTAMKLLECYCCKTVPDLGYEQPMNLN